MIKDDPARDKATGLLNRQAFLAQVKKSQQEMPPRLRRGCLLILHFPVIKSACVGEDADDALLHLLAIIETRLRSRDAIGRIAPHALCILLKGCRERDAIVVADQYAALLGDVLIKVAGKQVPMKFRYRIVQLDARGSKPRQGVSRLIVAPPLSRDVHLAKQIHVSGNRVDLSASKVVSLNAARLEKSAHNDDSTHDRASDDPSAEVHQVGAFDSSRSWRLRPGLLVQRKTLVCCFRLQPVGVVNTTSKLQESSVFASILNALSLKGEQSRPIIESQIILPVQAEQIDEHFADWVKSQCKQMRVAPSDICLSFAVESISEQLRSIAPALRKLNRAGIALMLEGVASSNQLRMMANLAHFDYLYVSGRCMNDTLSKLSERVELESIIADAKANHCEISAGGIDSKAMFDHAMNMKVEIGFGRECGVSVAFPEAAWVSAIGTEAVR